MAATKKERIVQFKVEKAIAKEPGTITVSVPKGLNDREFVAILGKLRGLTSCPACASSGGHRVIFDPGVVEHIRF